MPLVSDVVESEDLLSSGTLPLLQSDNGELEFRLELDVTAMKKIEMV